MVRVDLEDGRFLVPGVEHGLERGSPSERLEVLGEAVGSDEAEDVDREALGGLVGEGFHGDLLDRSVHPLRLAIRPRVIRPGELVSDAVLPADAVERDDLSVPLGRGIGREGDAVVGGLCHVNWPRTKCLEILG